MGWLDVLTRWRRRRERIEHEATTLITFLGDHAYTEARERARTCRRKADRDGDRLWSRVAVRIAKRTGREIGMKAADRYEQEATPQGKARARHQHQVALGTRAILAALAAIAHGRHVGTELHNIAAHIRNAEMLVAADGAVAAAGAEVVRTATRLAAAAERSGQLFGQRLYPPELDEAGHAVERWRVTFLNAAPRSGA